MWLEQAEIDLEVLFLERFEIAIVSNSWPTVSSVLCSASLLCLFNKVNEHTAKQSYTCRFYIYVFRASLLFLSVAADHFFQQFCSLELHASVHHNVRTQSTDQK